MQYHWNRKLTCIYLTISSVSTSSSVFSLSLAILYLGIIAWIVSFDTYYAMEDKDDDLKINVNSTAILGGNNAVKYAQIIHIFFIVVSRNNKSWCKAIIPSITGVAGS